MFLGKEVEILGALDTQGAIFAKRNPGHGSGDELVSITELHADNLTSAGRRVVREGQRRVALGRVAT